MRRLDRSSAPVPACLGRFRVGRDDWSSTTYEDREEIRACLGAMQRSHCAYCERNLANESRNPHIEHFEQQKRAPKKIFAWDNLFWSCSSEEHCGKRKDQLVKSYRHADLLKPDVDDPRGFLRFYSDGSVAPRPGLNPADAQRASETIRAFGLDLPRLRTDRKAYLAAPLKEAQDVATAGFPDTDAMDLLRDSAKNYENSAFSAAIFDMLGV
jgi:uncharacterized protein (TIGR02646 family)